MNISVQSKDYFLIINIDARDVTPQNFPLYANQVRTAIMNNYTPNATVAALSINGPLWVVAATVCIVQTLMSTVGLVQGDQVIVVATTTPEYAPGMVLQLPK